MLMTDSTRLYLETPLAKSVTILFKKLEARLGLNEPVDALIAGGIAMHFYTGTRIACDVDVQFSPYILIPEDLMVEGNPGEDFCRPLYFDVGHNLNFSLVHPEYLRDTVPLDLGLDFINPFLLSPVDMVVSKIARLSEVDQRDIVQLSRLGLVASDAVEHRAKEAMEECVCNRLDLHVQIQKVLRLIE